MTDDPLAHLYAEGLETDAKEILASTVTHLQDLLEEGPEDEELDDHDLDELALLVRRKTLGGAGGITDQEGVELGLGTMVVLEGRSEFALNDLGRAVLKRLADWRAAALAATERKDR